MFREHAVEQTKFLSIQKTIIVKLCNVCIIPINSFAIVITAKKNFLQKLVHACYHTISGNFLTDCIVKQSSLSYFGGMDIKKI